MSSGCLRIRIITRHLWNIWHHISGHLLWRLILRCLEFGSSVRLWRLVLRRQRWLLYLLLGVLGNLLLILKLSRLLLDLTLWLGSLLVIRLANLLNVLWCLLLLRLLWRLLLGLHLHLLNLGLILLLLRRTRSCLIDVDLIWLKLLWPIWWYLWNLEFVIYLLDLIDDRLTVLWCLQLGCLWRTLVDTDWLHRVLTNDLLLSTLNLVLHLSAMQLLLLLHIYLCLIILLYFWR